MVTEIENLATGDKTKLVSDGVFVFIGMKPNIDLFRTELELDQWGYIKADENMQTSLAGIYAVGDVISKKYRQITTAVADGTIAAMAIAKELN
jgi:thioredoxin reductase (NADPH)